MFLCGVADAFARGVEGKLRFAARGAWPHGPAAWRENSASLRAMRWQHGPRCGRKTSLCCVWCAGSMALRRGGKTPCFCAMRWQHGPAAWGENSASLRGVRGRTALRCGGKIPCCCAMRWQHGLRRRGKASLRAVRGRTALRRRGKIPCCCAMRWQHGLRRGGKTSLCAVGERGKTGNILFQNVLFQKNNTRSSQFYGCAPVSQAAGCVLMAWNTAMSNFGSRL